MKPKNIGRIVITTSVALASFCALVIALGRLAHEAKATDINSTLISSRPFDGQTTTPITPGFLTFHEADATIVYNWFTFVPTTTSKTEPSYIWISGVHGNVLTDDYGEITAESQAQALGRISWANAHRYILLVPVIPRPATNPVYAVAFDWKVFLSSTISFCQRPDIKVNLMIDELISELQSNGYNVQERVLIDGFSAGGMFAQRFALLHPERVQALAAGSCGGALTLPESQYNSTPMDWPVGVNDFSSLVGYEFTQTAYRHVPQFIYIGDKDTNNSTLWGTGELWRTQSQIDFLNSTFGYTDPVRIENQSDYLEALGYNVTFKLYPGVGHQRTSEMMNDTFAFFTRAIYPHTVYLPLVEKSHTTAFPVVVHTNPLDGATDINRSLTAVSITFSKSMRYRWSLSSSGGFPLSSETEVTYDPVTCTFTFTRTSTDLLPPGSLITFTINPQGYEPGFIDLEGNPASTSTFSFTTAD